MLAARPVLATLAVALALLVAAGTRTARAADVDCMTQPLGPIDTWSIVVNGDLEQSNTDAEGRVAAGGDVTLSSYGVASKLPTDGSRVDLVAGGDLTGANVGVNHGSVTYGGTFSGGVFAPNGTITRAAPQQDFKTLFTAAAARSAHWASLPADGTVSGPVYGALSLTGESATLNVFTIAAAKLQTAQRILLRVPFGSSTLINVMGDAYTTAQHPTVSVELWDGTAYQQLGNEAPSPELEALRRGLLWNFPTATAVQIGPNLAWQGSVLAPYAALTFRENAQLNGTIVANSLRGGGETHLHPPTGICLPEPPPCPVPPDPPDPTPTPAPEPAPKPDPTPDPTPIAPPAPDEPTPSAPGEALPPGSTGAASVDSPEHDGRVGVCKKVLSKRGRALERVRARAGDTVRFRIRITNLGTRLLRDLRICDRIPDGMALVRAPGSPKLVGGRLCWSLKTLTGQVEAFATVRITRTTPGLVVNTVSVTTANGGSDRNTASVRVLAPRAAGEPGSGGVTG
jgi:choice-of-anchor A domain-containing protein/uncharacterized repeat protein (TIGR01451 family)